MVPSGLMPPVIAVSASISSPRMAARTPTVYSPLLLLPSTKPPAGSNLNSYCLGSIPRRSEASATPVQPDADSDGPMPDTSVSAKLTFISPVSDGPTVILSVIASPTNPSGPSPTPRAVTSTVRAVASGSSMAWVSRGGPGPSCFGLEAPPPQAINSRAIPANAAHSATPLGFVIAFLPSSSPDINVEPRSRFDGRGGGSALRACRGGLPAWTGDEKASPEAGTGVRYSAMNVASYRR